VARLAKLHHTVPRFYLHSFANDAERITTVRLPGDRRYTQGIGSAAATNHFYSIDGHPRRAGWSRGVSGHAQRHSLLTIRLAGRDAN
jgi:Protein of unknown function (DUF4238)